MKKLPMDGSVRGSYTLVGTLLIFVVVFLPLLLAVSVRAAEGNVNANGAGVESLVLATLQKGQVADAANSELSLDFIVSLLMLPEKQLPGGVRIRQARFSSRLDLSNVQIPGSLWLLDCQFADGIDLSGTRIAGDLSLEQSHFAYPPGSQGTNDIFIGLKVLGDTNLTGTTFDGPADFTYAEFRGEFSADGAKFLAPETSADFQYVQFREGAFFRQPSFGGTLKMWYAEIQDMDLTFDANGKIPRIEMPQAVVQRSLSIQGGELDYLGLASLRVLGIANLGPVCISHQLDLHRASFDTVSFNVRPCQNAATQFMTYVSGLRYFFLTSDDGGPPTDSFLQTLLASNFKGIPNDPNNPPDPGLFAQYAQFEAFLRSHNYSDDADRALVAGKVRERETISTTWFSLSRWKSVFEDLSVGYGTKPLRPLVACIVVVILGTIILSSPNQMKWMGDNREPPKYSAFWYTLDKFAPVIDLRVADLWEPKTVPLQRCALGLRILGFILAPLTLAALTGSFK